MKLLFRILFISLILCTTIVSQDFVSDVSKKGTSAASFLSISQGAKASSMGSAFVALADDQSTLYWNVAGIADIKGAGVLVEHTNWIADINYNYLAATYSIGDYGTIGLSFLSSDINDLDVTTVDDPEGTGETFSVADVVFGLAYAMKLTDNFSIGFNSKFIQQKIWKMSANAIALDLGVKYVTPFDGIVLGMSISNFGTQMRMDGNSALILYDPDPNSTGNNGKIPANLQTDSWDLPLIFRVGLAYKAIETDYHRITVAVDALHPSDNFESINIGGEYTFNDMFSVRGGYKSLFLSTSEESFTLGVGFKQLLLGNLALKVDYAYADFGRLSDIQKFSLSVLF